MNELDNHTRECDCNRCIEARSAWFVKRDNEDRLLSLIALMLDELDISSCTVVGYGGNHWTITDSRG